MPAPKLFTSLPEASNFRIGATVRADAVLAATTLEHPDAAAVAIDVDRRRWIPSSAPRGA